MILYLQDYLNYSKMNYIYIKYPISKPPCEIPLNLTIAQMSPAYDFY